MAQLPLVLVYPLTNRHLLGVATHLTFTMVYLLLSNQSNCWTIVLHLSLRHLHIGSSSETTRRIPQRAEETARQTGKETETNNNQIQQGLRGEQMLTKLHPQAKTQYTYCSKCDHHVCKCFALGGSELFQNRSLSISHQL